MSHDCPCAPDSNGVTIHNSWAHPEWDADTDSTELDNS